MDELNMLPTFMGSCYSSEVRFWTCMVIQNIFLVKIKHQKDILNAEWLDAIYKNIYEIGYDKNVSLQAARTFLVALKGTKTTMQFITDNQYETPLLYAFESLAFDHCTNDEHTYDLPYILLESLERLVYFYQVYNRLMQSYMYYKFQQDNHFYKLNIRQQILELFHSLQTPLCYHHF